MNPEYTQDMSALIREAETMAPEARAEALREKSQTLLPALAEKTGSESKARELFIMFILCALLADNKLEEAEFTLLKPALTAFFGADTDIEAVRAKLLSSKEGTEALLQNADLLIDILGEDDPALKKDCVLTALLLSAADGKVSAEERAYLEKLMD